MTARVREDAGHLDHPAFELDGEIETFKHTAKTLQDWLTPDGTAALCAEIVGQSCYFECEGEFPTVGSTKVQRLPVTGITYWYSVAKMLL